MEQFFNYASDIETIINYHDFQARDKFWVCFFTPMTKKYHELQAMVHHQYTVDNESANKGVAVQKEWSPCNQAASRPDALCGQAYAHYRFYRRWKKTCTHLDFRKLAGRLQESMPACRRRKHVGRSESPLYWSRCSLLGEKGNIPNGGSYSYKAHKHRLVNAAMTSDGRRS